MSQRGYTPRFVRLRSRPGGRWLVHEDLRTRLVEDAERNGISLIDQVTTILAEKYGVPFAPTVRKTTPAKTGEELNLILPDRLDSKIERATRNPQTIADTIRRALSDHYGFDIPPKPTRTSVRPAA